MPLGMAIEGEERVIQKFACKEEVKMRLCEMGFVTGEKIKVVGFTAGGIVIQVKGTKVALDRGLASRIIVH